MEEFSKREELALVVQNVEWRDGDWIFLDGTPAMCNIDYIAHALVGEGGMASSIQGASTEEICLAIADAILAHIKGQ